MKLALLSSFEHITLDKCMKQAAETVHGHIHMPTARAATPHFHSSLLLSFSNPSSYHNGGELGS